MFKSIGQVLNANRAKAVATGMLIKTASEMLTIQEINKLANVMLVEIPCSKHQLKTRTGNRLGIPASGTMTA
jgi:hypothetical protein